MSKSCCSSSVNHSEDSSSLGEIKINHAVVASIVRLSALEIAGVHSIGGSFVDGIAEIFTKKDNERGIRVLEDEAGHYSIEVRVVLHFGVELAKIALAIQHNVREKVAKMTLKPVSRVDVIIEGVKMACEKSECKSPEEDHHALHTSHAG
jgi:uncharacterized alkaline shock family protein YloU